MPFFVRNLILLNFANFKTIKHNKTPKKKKTFDKKIFFYLRSHTTLGSNKLSPTTKRKINLNPLSEISKNFLNKLTFKIYCIVNFPISLLKIHIYNIYGLESNFSMVILITSFQFAFIKKFQNRLIFGKIPITNKRLV